MNDCIFCRIASGSVDPDLTVYEDAHVFIQISLHQKTGNRGHLLVIPKQHVANLFESPDELDAPLFSAIRRASTAVKKAFAADGIQIRQNNEAAAGQDVFHLHFHVIPRYHEDAFDRSHYELVPEEDRRNLADRINGHIH
ncbi:protein hit [Rubritalea halochordaticola]|uniref:Protein hit n=1 Tax=Rubritalea halochordaticola TaxID=714537 RepID=A0ABP9V490_9BACT